MLKKINNRNTNRECSEFCFWKSWIDVSSLDTGKYGYRILFAIDKVCIYFIMFVIIYCREKKKERQKKKKVKKEKDKDDFFF